MVSFPLSFDEDVLGWPTFYSYKPGLMFSLKNTFFTTSSGNIYEHYYENPPLYNSRCKFYGSATADEASITFIFNPQPSITKNFNTISYEGSSGWEVDSFEGDIEQANRQWDTASPSSIITGQWIENQDTTKAIYSFLEGTYEHRGVHSPSAVTKTEFGVVWTNIYLSLIHI